MDKTSSVEVIKRKNDEKDDEKTLKKIKREEEKKKRDEEKARKEEEKRIRKEKEEERKALKLKEEQERKARKLKEDEERRIRKEKEEEEKRLRREKIEQERLLKKEQKEKEKLEKQQKREEEARKREEKKRLEEEEKRKRREALEAKRIERELEKQQEEERKLKEKEREVKKKEKQSIVNFFKVSESKNDNEHKDGETDNGDGDYSVISENNSITEFEKYFFCKAPVTEEIHSKWDNIDDKAETNNDYNDQNKDKSSKITDNNIPPATIPASRIIESLNCGSIDEANELFRKVPLRYLKFYENRKAQITTFSRPLIKDSQLHPWNKFEGIDYDNDDDDIDDDGEEGEDINSDEEDEDDDDEEDDDDGDGDDDDDTEFVEKDGTITGTKRREGPLIAVVRHCHSSTTETDEFSQYFSTLQWTPLETTRLKGLKFPIDPYKDYWS